MTESATLLPSGLYDLLPPQASQEFQLVSTILAHFAQSGFQQVQPPLMEFAESLQAGNTEQAALQLFRAMDPLSQHMLGLRSDMTPQIARIAGGQLRQAPRPLRLCYAGQTLRTMPDSVYNSRQFRQIGLEIIGCDAVLADAEIIVTAISALAAAGITSLSLDLSLSPLIPLLMHDVASSDKEAVLRALAHKNTAIIQQLGHPKLAKLCSMTGSFAVICDKLAAMALPDTCQPLMQAAKTLANLLNDHFGDGLNITLDPLEMKGFGYYSGISFALYHPQHSRELGRGGRYLTPQGEAASGLTFYAEDICPLLPMSSQARHIAILGLPDAAELAFIRKQGFQLAIAYDELSFNLLMQRVDVTAFYDRHKKIIMEKTT